MPVRGDLRTRAPRSKRKVHEENIRPKAKTIHNRLKGKKDKHATRRTRAAGAAARSQKKDKSQNCCAKNDASTKNSTLFSIFLYHSPLHHNPSQNQRTECTQQPQSLQKRQGSRVKIRKTRKEHRQRDTRIKPNQHTRHSRESTSSERLLLRCPHLARPNPDTTTLIQ